MVWRHARSAPWLTGAGALVAVPWIVLNRRPKNERHTVQQVGMNDLGAARAALLRDGAVILRQPRVDARAVSAHAGAAAPAGAASWWRTQIAGWTRAQEATSAGLSKAVATGDVVQRAITCMELILDEYTATAHPLRRGRDSQTRPSAHTVRADDSMNRNKARFVESSKGRFHMSLLNNEKDALARDLQADAPWLELLKCADDGRGACSHPLGAAKCTKLLHYTCVNTPSHASAAFCLASSLYLAKHTYAVLSMHAHIELSMAQLLDSRPGSLPQNWHADNASGGWTVIMPLVDVTPQNGPTALQIGSHHYNRSWPMGWATAVFSATRLAFPEMARGDVLIYSSMLVHRGEANLSATSRPILVFRCVCRLYLFFAIRLTYPYMP